LFTRNFDFGKPLIARFKMQRLRAEYSDFGERLFVIETDWRFIFERRNEDNHLSKCCLRRRKHEQRGALLLVPGRACAGALQHAQQDSHARAQRTAGAVYVGGGGVWAVELHHPVNGWEIKTPGQSEEDGLKVLAGKALDLAATSVANRTAESLLQKS
jgi:hypothetical protein